MRKKLIDLRSFPTVVIVSISLLLSSACSTGGMEFTVSDQALNGDNTTDGVVNSQSQEVDQENEEENQPQVVIPNDSNSVAQESPQPVLEKEDNDANAELDCTEVSPPSISYWPYRSPRGESQNLMMLDARLGAHFDFDRFVLEFEPTSTSGIEGPPDSYSIQWVSQPPIQFGSGQELEVEGDEYLEILLHAHAYSRDTSEYAYEGPSEVQARGTINVIEAIFGGEVEGKMVWAIGVNKRSGFRILEISDPPRLVIDICTSTNG